MKSKKRVATGAMCVGILMLPGCGGGGGSSSSAAPATPASSPTVAPTTAAFSLLPSGTDTTYAPVGDVVTDSSGWINSRRVAMGLTALSNSVLALTTAASSHSTYLVLNNTNGHTETAGLPVFTGADPNTRIQAAHKTNFWGEVAVAGTGPQTSTTFAAENIFDAPYHRGVLMADYAISGVGFVTSGTGATQYSALTIDLADYKQVVGANQLVAYPYNNQKGVKTSWVAEESPNVFADQPQYIGQAVGYPIVLSGAVNSVIDISSFTLKDAAGNNVACKAQDHNTNSDAASFGVCVPYAPLTANTNYSVSVTGLDNGAAFSLSWSFTTGS